MKSLSKFSAYARPDSSLTEHTTHGAVVTLVGLSLAIFLAVCEVDTFYQRSRYTKMAVDVQRRQDLSIYIDITLPMVPCAVLSLEAMDVAGTSENDASSSMGLQMKIHKMRLDKDGKKLGHSEYHTPVSQQEISSLGGNMMNVNVPQALKHLSDMEEEAGRQEGCHVSGTMEVKRVAGRIRISAHQQMLFQMMPQLLGGHKIPQVYNMTHTVHTLSFGPKFPGIVNPLDHTTRLVEPKKENEFKDFKYYIKVVPTEYYGRLGGVTETHQYSLTEYSTSRVAGPSFLPSINMMYDISPIVVTVNDHPPSILHFIVRMCAVVGGVVAITQLVHKWVHWMLVDVLKF